MEKQYSLFYAYRKLDDIFAIVFHGYGKVTKKVRNKNVEALYNNENLCGYNIFNIKDIVKIKAKGLIYLPNKELIDLGDMSPVEYTIYFYKKQLIIIK